KVLESNRTKEYAPLSSRKLYLVVVWPCGSLLKPGDWEEREYARTYSCSAIANRESFFPVPPFFQMNWLAKFAWPKSSSASMRRCATSSSPMEMKICPVGAKSSHASLSRGVIIDSH